MTHPYMASQLAQAHERELRASVARTRLAAIANCCRPSRLRLTLTALRASLHREPTATLCCT